MARTKLTKVSPPPSPSTLLKAQIMVMKPVQEKAKAKKAAKAAKSHVEKENKGSLIRGRWLRPLLQARQSAAMTCFVASHTVP